MTETHAELRKHNAMHLTQQIKIGKFKCMLCKFANNHKLALTIHSIVHEQPPPYTCKACNMGGFDTAKKLMTHIYTHTGEDKLACSYSNCLYSSNSTSNMNRHYRLRHQGIIPTTSTAQATNASTAEENSFLKKHRCDQCTYWSYHSIGLDIHSVVHSSTFPWKCSECGLGGFSSIKKLSHHITSHTDLRKIECQNLGCFYATRLPCNLSRHYRKCHSGNMAQHRISGSRISRKQRGKKLGDAMVVKQAKLLSAAEICRLATESRLDDGMMNRPAGGVVRQLNTPPVQYAMSQNYTNLKPESKPRSAIFPSQQKELHECSMCAFSTKYLRILEQHYMLDHRKVDSSSVVPPRKQIRCEMCRFTTESPEEMSRHCHDKHTVKRCTLCSYSTVDEGHYSRHMQVNIVM